MSVATGCKGLLAFGKQQQVHLSSLDTAVAAEAAQRGKTSAEFLGNPGECYYTKDMVAKRRKKKLRKTPEKVTFH